MGNRIGQQLGNYRLLHLLGQGGFADVYLGEHIHLGTQAAIKVLQVRLGANSIQNFLNEARTIAHLVHPYIIRVLDFGVQDTIPFLVMDYAPKGTFRLRFLQGKPLPPAPLVSYMRQAAAALQYAHDRKFVHRDVKPENMLIGPNDEVLLSDFGFALIPQSSASRTLTEETAGTAAYMAPEQLQGKPRPASDQYALGIISYEWLCGNRPFDGSFFEIASQHVLTPVPSMREKVPTIPREIEKVVMKALDKNPQERYSCTRDFALALEEACLTAKQYGFDLPSGDALANQSTKFNTNQLVSEIRPGSKNQNSLRSNTFQTPSFSGRPAEQNQSSQSAIHRFPASEKMKSAYENFMLSQLPPTNESKSDLGAEGAFGPINRPTRKTTLQRQPTGEAPFQEYIAQFSVDDAPSQPINDTTLQQKAVSEPPLRPSSGIRPLSTLRPSRPELPPLKSQNTISGIQPFSRDPFSPSGPTISPAANAPATTSEVQSIFNVQQPTRDFPAESSQRLKYFNQPSPTKQIASNAPETRSGVERLTDLLNAQRNQAALDTQAALPEMRPSSTAQLSSSIQPAFNPQQTHADIKAYAAPSTLSTSEKRGSLTSSSASARLISRLVTRDIFTKITTLRRTSAWTNKIILFVVLSVIIITSSTFIYLANINKQSISAAPPITNINDNSYTLTATAQASATVTSIFNATATARNSKNPYPPNTGIIDTNDTLTNNNDHAWSENTDCQFAPDGYHVTANIGLSSTCFATNTNYKNFTYEVYMTFTKVGTEFSSAGVTFLGNHSTHQFYRFGIYASGRYNLELCAGDGAHCSSISDGKTAPPIAAFNVGKGGVNQPNVLAVEVLNNTLTIYVNNQLAINPVQLSPTNTTMGMIGVFANGGIDGETDALFDSAKIWAQ